MTQDNLYDALRRHIIDSTNQLQRELLQTLDAATIQQDAEDNSALALDDVFDDVLGATISGYSVNRTPRSTVSFEALGRSVLNKAGRSIGTQLGSAVSGALFGSTASASRLATQQLRNDIIKSIFK